MALGLLAAASLGAQAHEAAQSILFAPGASSQTVKLFLSPRHPHAAYSVKVREGQKMSIKVAGPAGDAVLVPDINVTSPSGHSSAADRPKAQRFDTASTEAGTYLIEVGANQMASNSRSGAVRLKIWAR